MKTFQLENKHFCFCFVLFCFSREKKDILMRCILGVRWDQEILDQSDCIDIGIELLQVPMESLQGDKCSNLNYH